MKAVLFDRPGDPDVLYLGEAPSPSPGPSEIRIRSQASSVNRADLLQRRGHYPPPKGESPILGLEVAGTVAEIGKPGEVPETLPFQVGDRVMALLAGGGYAEEVVVPVGQVLPIPPSLSFEEAAALPEVFLTAYLNLYRLGNRAFSQAEPKRRVLIHGGASGVGTAALQLLSVEGAQVYCTVGAEERKRAVLALAPGCQVIHYKEQDFSTEILGLTQGRGVDLILDCVGAAYLSKNLHCLAEDGKLVCIGLLSGAKAEIDLALLLRKRHQIIGSTLRSLPRDRKADLVRAFHREVYPLFERGILRPVIDQVFPLSQVINAHEAMDSHHVGKIVLSLRTT